MYNYQISISRNGKFIFRTDDTMTDAKEVAELLKTFKEKFPEADGWDLMLTSQNKTKTFVPIAVALEGAILLDDRFIKQKGK